MLNNKEDDRTFLEEQIKWCEEQDSILEEIEMKLYKMKDIAEFVRANDLSSAKIEEMNNQMKKLKKEVNLLEKKLYTNDIIH